MSPWKVILATMVIFVCGVVTGALVIKTQGNASPRASQFGDPGIGPPGPAQVREIIRWLNLLNLTTNQTVKIVKIMQDSQTTNRAIRETIAPQLRKEVDRAHQAINQLLTPEQQVKYAELLKKPEPKPEGRIEGGRGRRGGEGPGFPPRNTNRPQTNGFPGEGRGRANRTGATNNPSTNSIPTNSIVTNNLPTNSFLTNSVPTNGP